MHTYSTTATTAMPSCGAPKIMQRPSPMPSSESLTTTHSHDGHGAQEKLIPSSKLKVHAAAFIPSTTMASSSSSSSSPMMVVLDKEEKKDDSMSMMTAAAKLENESINNCNCSQAVAVAIAGAGANNNNNNVNASFLLIRSSSSG